MLVGQVRDHGGSLDQAAAMFPDAPKPWIDCSTGINPTPYPYSPLPASAWERLPEPAAIRGLRASAARSYDAPAAENVVAAPGTQTLLPLVARLVTPGRARVLGPTYDEHARCAALAGHAVEEVAELEGLAEADLAVLVNPNNPDGRLHPPDTLLALARALAKRGGLLVVDEAFMDVAPDGMGLSGRVEEAGNIVVLRSFGKFFGLAGVRLGFAMAPLALALRLEAELGPWAVSGPAVAIGCEALSDDAWREAMRRHLADKARRLATILRAAGLRATGGTSLFRLVRTQAAPAVFEACGRAGIHVRRFDRMPDALRFGLPPDDEAFRRLSDALDAWHGKGGRARHESAA